MLGLIFRRRHHTVPPYLQFTTQPGGASSGSAFSPQPVVTAKNPDGTTKTSFTGNVTLAVNTVTGSHSLGGTVTVAAVAGVATFSGVTDTGSGNGTLTATATGYTSATSASFTTASGFTAFDKGFNFRQTSGYVTDGTNETYVLASDAYTGSVIRNGVAFGWTTALGAQDSRDRNSALDRRLSGIGFNDGIATVFRVDLPAAGTYSLRLAMGDPSNSKTISVTIKDGANTLVTISGVSVPAGSHLDATGTVYTDANWPASNSAVSKVFAGTVLTVEIPISTPMCHLFVSRTA